MSILLIEDDLQLAAEIKGVLEPLGHVVDHVDDGAAGLEKCLQGDYDLVVTDRMLPAIDGQPSALLAEGARGAWASRSGQHHAARPSAPEEAAS